MCHIIGIKPQFKTIIENGPYVPITARQRKPEGQWTGDERKDFQDSPNDEEDTRISQKYLTGLEEERHERDLLAKYKRFFKKGSQRFSSAKATNDTICHKCDRKDVEAKYNKVRAKLALLSFGSSSKSSMVKNKSLVAEAYEWYEEDVSSDDNEIVRI
ncbi:hypothetical protein Tco_0352812 [Tanacetum coccineum]